MITVEQRGKDGLVCADNIRADISVNFYVRVNPTREDMTQVARSIGVNRASAQETLNDLFQAKFSEALKTVDKRIEFEDLFRERILELEKQRLEAEAKQKSSIFIIQSKGEANANA